MAEMKRMSIRLSKELHGYYKDKSEKTGISMSILILTDLEHLAEQRDIKQQLAVFTQMIEKLESMEEKEMEEGADVAARQ
ncbi:MAG: hypothetical protein GX938_10190 [Spirochaetales bacterium]|nr:hypothetical protein [Spirochaetales bacterium]